MVSGTDATPPLFPQDKPASAHCPLPHRVAEISPLQGQGPHSGVPSSMSDIVKHSSAAIGPSSDPIHPITHAHKALDFVPSMFNLFTRLVHKWR